MNNRVKVPCKECLYRSLECHGRCEKYKVYVNQIEMDRQLKLNAKNIVHAAYATDRHLQALRKKKRLGKL